MKFSAVEAWWLSLQEVQALDGFLWDLPEVEAALGRWIPSLLNLDFNLILLNLVFLVLQLVIKKKNGATLKTRARKGPLGSNGSRYKPSTQAICPPRDSISDSGDLRYHRSNTR